MGMLTQDIRYGLRTLAARPAFTVVATLALALGIGANTAIFSAIHAVLLTPLPFAEPDRLVNIWTTARGGRNSPVSYPDFVDFRTQSESFESMAVFHTEDFTVTGSEQPLRLSGAVVSHNLFEVLGRRPAVGRSFQPEEDQLGARVAIISNGLWQQRFGSDKDITGRAITLNGQNYTVVGVMPAGFHFPFEALKYDVWITMGMHVPAPGTAESVLMARGWHFLEAIGRLKPGVSREQAQAELEGIAARLEQQYPESNTRLTAVLAPSFDQLVRDIRPTLKILFGAVGFVLLIACANVANLLLARATGRQREMAIRAALGAGRLRIVRQLLTESVLLALLGGGAGLLLALWATDVLAGFEPGTLPRATEIKLDGTVLGFTLLLSLLTGIVFGLVPAVQGSRGDLCESLKEGGRGSTDSVRRSRLRNALVAAEVGTAMILLIGAGLLVQSLWRIHRLTPGFNPKNVVTARLNLPETYGNPELERFYAQLHERLRTIPGVRSAGAVMPLPMSNSNMGTGVDIEGRVTSPSERPSTQTRVAGPDYFSAMGIPLIAGRDFTAGDKLQSKQVVIVSEAFVEQFFPNEDPLGRRIRPTISIDDSEGHFREIVGVVGSVRARRLTDEPRPEVYVPHAQVPFAGMTLALRTDGDPRAVIGALRAEVQSLDKDVPVYDVKSMEQYVGDSVSRQRLSAILLGLLAAVALLLTVLGLYGVLAYAVEQRTHEIGVRMALGAGRRDVLRMVLGHGIKMTLVGLVIGCAGAYALTRVLEGLLYEVKPTDPLTFGVIAAVLIIAAMTSCYLPARRAMAVDPIVALRYE